MSRDTWEVRFAPIDCTNPSLGYGISIRRNGCTVYASVRHPVTGKDLDYEACLDVASMYGPPRKLAQRPTVHDVDTLVMKAAPAFEAHESSTQVDRQEFPAAETTLGAFGIPEACDCGETDCIHEAFLKLPPH